jgi:hypothetical protein
LLKEGWTGIPARPTTHAFHAVYCYIHAINPSRLSFFFGSAIVPIQFNARSGIFVVIPGFFCFLREKHRQTCFSFLIGENAARKAIKVSELPSKLQDLS